MATTTNYGWTTPDNTAYVKYGAAAIRSLGSAVDTTSATTNAAGLVFLRTVTIGTAVASVSIGATGNPLFTSAYDNYRIIYQPYASSTTGSDLRFRYRSGNTDNTTSNYNWAGNSVGFTGTATTVFGAGQNQGFFGFGSYTSSAAWGSHIIDIEMPFLAQYTSHESVGTGVSAAGLVIRCNSGGYFNAVTSFDGITFLPIAGTLTGGTISVYGYRKAI